MQKKSFLARLLTALCLFWLMLPPAQADVSYLSQLCSSGGACVRKWAPMGTDLSPAFNNLPGCDHPGSWDFNAPSPYTVTQADDPFVADAYGHSEYIPVRYTGCTYEHGGLIQNTLGEPPGTVHTGKNSGFAVTYCFPGYAYGKLFSNSYPACIPDPAAAVATDSTNEQGAPPACDKCTQKFLQEVAPDAGPMSPVVGDPINASNGNELLTESDYTSNGGSLLTFERTYNSGAGFIGGGLGPNWSHTYRYRANFGADASTVVLLRPDGTSSTFVLTQGVYVGPPSDKGKLQVTFSNTTPTGIKYTRPDGTTESYTGATGADWGVLTQIAFGQGGTITIVPTTNGLPSSIKDDRGHTLTLSYTTVAGITLVSKATLPDSTTVTYGYDTYGRLTSATYPDQSVRKYTYLAATNTDGSLSAQRYKLTGITDEAGRAFVNVAYDTLGRATASWNGTVQANLTQVVYGNQVATVTDALGVVSQMAFSSPDSTYRVYTSSVVKYCGNGCSTGQGNEGYGYDTSGNATSVTDLRGLTTCIGYSSSRNLPVTVVQGVLASNGCASALTSPPAGTRMRTYQWHATLAVPLLVTGPQSKISYTYDGFGRTLTETDVATNDLTGALGASAAQVGTARTTTLTYDAKGSLTSLKSSRTDVNSTTTYAYDANENLTSMTDAVGLKTTLSNYDANGRPGMIVYANGLQTSLVYDARGRLTQIVANGEATTYGYDSAGLLTSAVLPSGLSLSMVYDDAQRLVSTQDSSGNSVVLTLDAAGDVLQESIQGSGAAVAVSRQAAYDQLSRVTAIVKAQ